MLGTINNIIRTLLFQAHLPPTYWVEALHMATHLLNILPSSSIKNDTPHFRLLHKQPDYAHLRVFGCLCYPHIQYPHKLSPRSSPCIFLGYPSNHRGYRCLDLSSRKIIISRHVIFDETSFPYKSMTPQNPPSYSFLDDDLHTLSPLFRDTFTYTTTPPSQPSGPPLTSSPVQGPMPHASASPSPQLNSENSPNPPPSSSQTETTIPHPMITRGRNGITRPVHRLNLHISSMSPVPRSHLQAIADPNWRQAMHDEYNALIANDTWTLVPRPQGVNIVRSMWLFRHKFHADVTLSRYKARLVANGRSQQQGIDCDETFNLVVKPATFV